MNYFKKKSWKKTPQHLNTNGAIYCSVCIKAVSFTLFKAQGVHATTCLDIKPLDRSPELHNHLIKAQLRRLGMQLILSTTGNSCWKSFQVPPYDAD